MKPGDLLLMRAPFGNFLVYFVRNSQSFEYFVGVSLHNNITNIFFRHNIVANCTNLFENRF